MIEAALKAGDSVPDKFRNPWITLIGSTCCILLGPAVLGFYTLSLFMGSLEIVIGVGRGALSLSITVGTLTTAVSAPMIGRLIDRRGGRAVLIPAAIALSGVLERWPTAPDSWSDSMRSSGRSEYSAQPIT